MRYVLVSLLFICALIAGCASDDPTEPGAATNGSRCVAFDNFIHIEQTFRPSDPGSSRRVRVAGGLGFIADGDAGAHVFAADGTIDFSTAVTVATSGPAVDVLGEGTKLFIAESSDGVTRYDISDISAPVFEKRLNTPSEALALAVDDDFLYVVDALLGLLIVDRGTFQIVGGDNTIGQPKDVVLVPPIALVADAQLGLRVVDVSDPQAVDVSVIPVTNGLTRLHVNDDRLYAVNERDRVHVFDIRDARLPGLISAPVVGSTLGGVLVDGSMMYAADGIDGIQAYDVTDVSAPSYVATIGTPGTAGPVAKADGRLLLADGSGGTHVIDLGRSKPAPIVDTLPSASILSLTRVGNALYGCHAGGVDVIGVTDKGRLMLITTLDSYNDPRHVVTDGTTAYITHAAGVAVLDVLNPLDPVVVGSGVGGNYERIAVGDSLLTGVRRNGGFVVYRRTENGLQLVGQLPTLLLQFDVVLAGTHALIAAHAAGVVVIDVSNSALPRGVGATGSGGQGGMLDGTALAVALVDATTAIASVATRGVNVVDFSIPSQPARVSSLETPGSSFTIASLGGIAYIADRSGGLQVIDANDMLAPRLLGTIHTPGSVSTVAVGGGQVFAVDSELGVITTWTACR